MDKRIHDQEYNRGEWAELYVFLRLLGTGRLHAADSDLNCKTDSFLEVSKVLRCEAAGEPVVTRSIPRRKQSRCVAATLRVLRPRLQRSDATFRATRRIKRRSFPAKAIPQASSASMTRRSRAAPCRRSP